MTRKSVRPRILVCEDEMMVAHHIAAIVEDAGCEVVGPYSTSREALVAIRKRPVDCAILDIELADGASTPLARNLRTAGVTMIVLSGLRTNSPPPEFAGVKWLDKPVDESHLRAFCSAALAIEALKNSPIDVRLAEPVVPSAL